MFVCFRRFFYIACAVFCLSVCSVVWAQEATGTSAEAEAEAKPEAPVDRVGLMLAARRAEKEGDLAKAKALLSQLLALSPNDTLVREKLSQVQDKALLENKEKNQGEKALVSQSVVASPSGQPAGPALAAESAVASKPVETADVKVEAKAEEKPVESSVLAAFTLKDSMPGEPKQNTSFKGMEQMEAMLALPTGIDTKSVSALEKVVAATPSGNDGDAVLAAPARKGHHTIIDELSKIQVHIEGLREQHLELVEERNELEAKEKQREEDFEVLRTEAETVMHENERLQEELAAARDHFIEEKARIAALEEQLQSLASAKEQVDAKLLVAQQDSVLVEMDRPSYELVAQAKVGLQVESFADLSAYEFDLSAQDVFDSYLQSKKSQPDGDVTLQRLFLAAMKGSPEAQVEIAQRRMEGEFLSLDTRPALDWLFLAIRSGSVPAMELLGDLFVKGERLVKGDMVEAYAWYEVSAYKGSERVISKLRNLESELIRNGYRNKVMEARILANKIIETLGES